MGPKEYINSLFVSEDDVLASIEKGLIERGMPKISVPPEVGKTIYLLAKMVGAKRILEIGALGGYSTIWLARALPEDGQVVSLELSSAHAAFAQENVQRAGVGDRVTFCVGDAQESLKRLELQGETFDFFFIDADKENYPTYLESAFRLAHPGAIIAADNTCKRDAYLIRMMSALRPKQYVHLTVHSLQIQGWKRCYWRLAMGLL